SERKQKASVGECVPTIPIHPTEASAACSVLPTRITTRTVVARRVQGELTRHPYRGKCSRPDVQRLIVFEKFAEARRLDLDPQHLAREMSSFQSAVAGCKGDCSCSCTGPMQPAASAISKRLLVQPAI